jgi:hypothetical protein
MSPDSKTTSAASLAHLHDLDQMLGELTQPGGRALLRRLGLETPGLGRLRGQRERLAATLDTRWRQSYERVRARYPRAIAAVRAQVCTGCFVTLPPTARGRAAGDEPSVCQGCGRILLWL